MPQCKDQDNCENVLIGGCYKCKRNINLKDCFVEGKPQVWVNYEPDEHGCICETKKVNKK
jgi:hypothetical protein